MRKSNPLRPALVACVLVIALPATLLAAEPADQDGPRVVVVQDDGRSITIDMEAVNEIVAEAMEGVTEVMAEMEDMQFQMHLGRDNRLNLSYDDTTFELDLDQIMEQVAVAVEVGLEGLDTAEWTDSRERWDEADETELRRELDKLKDEMRELKRELRRAKDDVD
jgi:hypothetical protein